LPLDQYGTAFAAIIERRALGKVILRMQANPTGKPWLGEQAQSGWSTPAKTRRLVATSIWKPLY